MPDAPARVAAVLRAGDLAVIPTDTVYGLACTALTEESVRRLYALKGRPAIQPSAVVVASVARVLELVPEADTRRRAVLEALLPGPWTLVLPNPARRLPWLNAGRPEAIGVRVPSVAAAVEEMLVAAGPLVATSANLPGGRDPCSLAEVPPAILGGVAAVLDAGRLPGVPSTVVDLTGDDPVVIREGAVPADLALARIRAVLA